MNKWTLVLLVFVFALAGCAAPASQTTQEASPILEATQTNPPEPSPLVEQTAEIPVDPAPTQEILATPAETPGSSVASEGKIYTIIPGESQASYEVGETFFNENNRFAVAIGVTSEISGEITIDETNPQQSQVGVIVVDISRLRSNSSRRDGTIRDRFLESSRYPLATFVPGLIEGLPERYTPGEVLSFQVSGDLTIRETTRQVVFDVTAGLQDGTLSGSAQTMILMSDFGFGPILMAGILGTEDEVKLSFDFIARP